MTLNCVVCVSELMPENKKASEFFEIQRPLILPASYLFVTDSWSG